MSAEDKEGPQLPDNVIDFTEAYLIDRINKAEDPDSYASLIALLDMYMEGTVQCHFEDGELMFQISDDAQEMLERVALKKPPPEVPLEYPDYEQSFLMETDTSGSSDPDPPTTSGG